MPKHETQAFHIHAGFKMLLYDLKEENVPKDKWPKITNNFINLDEYGFTKEEAKEYALKFKGNGRIAVGYTSVDISINNNKVKSIITNHPVKGDKKWKTEYYAVLDSPDSKKEIPGTRSSIKKDCIDAARKITDLTGRPSYIIITKAPDGFSEVSAEINYIAKEDQDLNTYCWIW
jgi:hypothetical protein